MDSILSGLNGFSGILDDLIVTDPNDKERLSTLENTLKRLNSIGAVKKLSVCLCLQLSILRLRWIGI